MMIAPQKPKTPMSNKENFFRRNIFILLSFLAPMLILSAVFALKDFYPFGNRMILNYDGWHQYYPFLAEYQRMLKEGSSIFYSWNTGGGANFFGVIANYVASPLYLLSVFVPTGTPWLQVFLTATVVLRVGIAGMSFAVLLRKLYGRNDLSLVTFSLMYALCAYILGYYWNMMWLDTVAIMPLVIAGVVSVLRDKKFSLYIISLALSIVCSFYIGYMVCLFVLIFCICYTVVSFVSVKHSFKNAGKMLVYTLIAFMLTAVVTVPAFLMLQSSDSAGSVSEFSLSYKLNVAYGYKEGNVLINTLMAIARTVTNLLAYTKPVVVDKGLPNIACGVLSLVLIPFYFFTKKIKLKEKLVSLCLLVFFVLSFVVNQLNYIWHGMSTPAMVYYRWSFIFSFLVVLLAYRAFTLVDFFSKKTFIFASAIMVLYLACAFFLQRKSSVIITAAGAAVIIAGLVLYRKKIMGYRLLSLLLCLFVICEMGLNTYYGVTIVGSTTIGNYPQNYAQIKELNKKAEENSAGDSFYRSEFISPFSLNDGDLYSMYTITTFNSMVDYSYTDFLSEFGLASSKSNNRYAYYQGTPVADLFLNIRYLYGRDGKTALSTKYIDTIATTDECVLYENKAYVPMGFVTDESLLEYKLHDKSYLSIWTQNDIFRLATGIEEPVLVEIEPVSSPEITEDFAVIEGFEHKYSFDSDSTEETVLTFDYDIDEEGSYYGCFYSSSVGDTELVVNDDEDNALTFNQKYSHLEALGEYKKGDKLTARIRCEAGKKANVTAYLVRLDEAVFDKGVSVLSESTMKTTDWYDRGFTGTIDVKESGLLYTSVLYADGFRAFVDGEEAEITPVADTFVAVPVTEGEHTIELRFTPAGIKTGVAVTALGVVLFALLCFVSKRGKVCCEEEGVCDCKESEEAEKVTETDSENHTEENSDNPAAQ